MKDAKAAELIRIGFWSAVGGAMFSATVVLALLAFGAIALPAAMPNLAATRKLESKQNCGCGC